MIKKILATIVVAIALMSVITARAMEEGNTYTSMGIITNVDYATDTVKANMLNGHSFTFYGCSDWYNGDFIILELSDNGTPGYFEDDIILKDPEYEGSLHWIMTGSRGFGIANLDDKGITGYDWFSWDEPEVDMYDNFINAEEIVGFTATESGLQIHFESGNGYWWEY